MKCFQLVGQGVPVRMSDDDAFQIVERDKDGQYCPKKLWRENYASDYYTSRGDSGHYKLTKQGKIVPHPVLNRRADHA